MNKCANIKSAENCKEFSETIRQISSFDNGDKLLFFKWLAVIIDGEIFFFLI